jgi:hypothetical protein
LAKAFDDRLVPFEVPDQSAKAYLLRRNSEYDPASRTTHGAGDSKGGKILHDLVQMIARQTTKRTGQCIHTHPVAIRLASEEHEDAKRQVSRGEQTHAGTPNWY